jgi:deoxyribodipyrimidine photo-lyase
MATGTVLLLFRRDLRLADNAALMRAVAMARPVVPAFIWSLEEEGAWSPGAASRWWLHQSLASLDADLRRIGSRLVLRSAGSCTAGAGDLATEAGADTVLFNRLYEPGTARRDAAMEGALRGRGLHAESFPGHLLREPTDVSNRQGRPFQVFTPFYNAAYAAWAPEDSLPAPRALSAPRRWPRSEPLDALRLESSIDRAGGIRAAWAPGRSGATALLRAFIDAPMREYPTRRDRPDLAGTSRLSPHLHFGEISPREVLSVVARAGAVQGRKGSIGGSEAYARQLAWREFGHHLLHHFPHTSDAPLRDEFRRFPWRRSAPDLRAWQKGMTGYPVVDAGMRELAATGWMHNRVRMIVASFLVKDLLLPWSDGARWFWDRLVDADLANNTLGWQWTAGCGADAAPYFRIFNPVLQGRKFDPDGSYVRRWIPELERMHSRWIHAPWEAPPLTLDDAGVRLGKDYPQRIVDHAAARARALAALSVMQGAHRKQG